MSGSCSMSELGRQLARMHLAEPAVRFKAEGFGMAGHRVARCFVRQYSVPYCCMSELRRQLARMHLAEPAVRVVRWLQPFVWVTWDTHWFGVPYRQS
jgi:hypothetical protein